MPRIRPALCGAASLAILGIAGCGSSGSSSSSLAGRSPQQVLLAAASSVSGPGHFDLTGKVSADASGVKGGVPGDLSSFLGGFTKGVDLSAKGAVESAQRQRVEITTNGQTIVVVLYDGSAYYSLDGTSFGTTSAAALSGSTGLSVTPDQAAKLIENLPGAQDKGPTTQDGVAVEHYAAPVDSTVLQTLLAGTAAGSGSSSSSGSSGSASSDLGSGFAQLFAQVLTVKDGSVVDAYVRSSDGKLDRVDTKVGIGLDIGKIQQLLGGLLGGLGGSSSSSTGSTSVTGELVVSLEVHLHDYDYGTAVTVTRPTVDPNARPLPAGGLFGGAQ